MQRKTDKYRLSAISATIHQYWERRQEGIVLKLVKPKATWSAFATGVTYDSEKASDIANSAVVPTTIIKKFQLPNINTKNWSKKRKHNREVGRNNNTSQMHTYSQYNISRLPIPDPCTHPRRANRMEKRYGKEGCELCSVYEGVSHFFTRCYLVLGQDKEWIPKDNREIFRVNMKVLSFRKKVDDFKASQKSFEDWRYKNKSSRQDKIMGKVLALSDWDMHIYNSDNDYSLLHSATSVYVFHDKN